MKIDYSKMELGTSPGHGIILAKCPVCGRPCHETKTRYERCYRHEVEVVRRFGRNELDVMRQCVKPLEKQPQEKKP